MVKFQNTAADCMVQFQVAKNMSEIFSVYLESMLQTTILYPPLFFFKKYFKLKIFLKKILIRFYTG